jgi:hypothetical protein
MGTGLVRGVCMRTAISFMSTALSGSYEHWDNVRTGVEAALYEDWSDSRTGYLRTAFVRRV